MPFDGLLRAPRAGGECVEARAVRIKERDFGAAVVAGILVSRMDAGVCRAAVAFCRDRKDEEGAETDAPDATCDHLHAGSEK